MYIIMWTAATLHIIRLHTCARVCQVENLEIICCCEVCKRDLHAQHRLFLDSFIVSTQLIYCKMILRHAWHCIIGPTVFAITTCQLILLWYFYDPGNLPSTHLGAVLGSNPKGSEVPSIHNGDDAMNSSSTQTVAQASSSQAAHSRSFTIRPCSRHGSCIDLTPRRERTDVLHLYKCSACQRS